MMLLISAKQLKQLNVNLSEWPNTYTLTKCIAENVVYKFCKENNIKFGIVRPGIIGVALCGWYLQLNNCPTFYIGVGIIDQNFYFKGAGTGFMSAVPVDVVVN